MRPFAAETRRRDRLHLNLRVIDGKITMMATSACSVKMREANAGARKHAVQVQG
jgi:hypothetical protein